MDIQKKELRKKEIVDIEGNKAGTERQRRRIHKRIQERRRCKKWT